MNLFAAVIFLFASLAGAPAPCSHAMGQDGADEASHSMNDSHAHHDMDHRAPDASDNDAAADHQDHNCADGCDGGVGCEGCTITTAAISTADEFYRNFITHTDLPATFVAAADKLTTLDPPPPRT